MFAIIDTNRIWSILGLFYEGDIKYGDGILNSDHQAWAFKIYFTEFGVGEVCWG